MLPNSTLFEGVGIFNLGVGANSIAYPTGRPAYLIPDGYTVANAGAARLCAVRACLTRS